MLGPMLFRKVVIVKLLRFYKSSCIDHRILKQVQAGICVRKHSTKPKYENSKFISYSCNV